MLLEINQTNKNFTRNVRRLFKKAYNRWHFNWKSRSYRFLEYNRKQTISNTDVHVIRYLKILIHTHSNNSEYWCLRNYTVVQLCGPLSIFLLSESLFLISVVLELLHPADFFWVLAIVCLTARAWYWNNFFQQKI